MDVVVTGDREWRNVVGVWKDMQNMKPRLRVKTECEIVKLVLWNLVKVLDSVFWIIVVETY